MLGLLYHDSYTACIHLTLQIYGPLIARPHPGLLRINHESIWNAGMYDWLS